MTELQVGRFYPVTCVRAQWSHFGLAWWPTLGPMHNDRDIIGLLETHLHVDPRFVNRALQKKVGSALHRHARALPISVKNIVVPRHGCTTLDQAPNKLDHYKNDAMALKSLGAGDPEWIKVRRLKC